MAGLRGFHGNFGGLEVADFAYHDDVGILPQDRAQGAGKGKPGTRVDMHLIDPRQRVFDRILDSHDIYCRLTQHIETRVERDRQSTRLNSSNSSISYAAFCLK